MDKLLKVFGMVAAVGFAIAIVAIVLMLSGFNRDVGGSIFILGWVLTALGISCVVIFSPNSRFGRFSPLGLKIAAFGFLFIAIPNAMSEILFVPDSELPGKLFYIGLSIMLIGFVVYGYSNLSKLQNHR